MISACRNMSYSDRLKFTGLTTLEDRRDRGDLIEVFKFVKGFSKVNTSKFFVFSKGTRTRGHEYKLQKSRSRLDIRKHCFSQRVVDKWNSLPAAIVQAQSVNSFKNMYDKYRGSG